MDNIIVHLTEECSIQEDNFDLIFKKYEELSEKIELRLQEIKVRKSNKHTTK